MGLVSAKAKEDVYSFAAQGFHALPECDPASECRIDEWQHDDRRTNSGHLREDSQSVGITRPVCPFIDRVVRGGSNDDRIGYFRSRRTRLTVLAADGITGLFLDCFPLEEIQGGGSCHDLDGPVSVNGQLYQGGYLCRWACTADNHRQDAGGDIAGQRDTPICVANCSTSRRTVGGAAARSSATRR